METGRKCRPILVAVEFGGFGAANIRMLGSEAADVMASDRNEGAPKGAVPALGE